MANLEYSLVQPFMIYAEFTPSAVPLLRNGLQRHRLSRGFSMFYNNLFFTSILKYLK